jgi:hypothetical protein
MIDAASVDTVVHSHQMAGVFSTLGLIMVNSVSASQLDNDAYTDGACSSGCAKGWLILGLMISFGSLIAGIWLFVQE